VTGTAADTLYLDYAVRWRAGQAVSGRHPSRLAGAGGHFRACRPFWQVPDARKIDVRRSIMDPFGETMVRQTDDRAAITVVLAADVSRSMQASPASRNLGDVADLAEAIARSAHRAGDAFGLLAFDSVLRDELCLPPGRSRGAAATAVAGLRHLAATGQDGGGILHLAAALPMRRCLVLLASDFLLPPDVLEQALRQLAKHDVAPIVFHDPREAELPQKGLLRMQDSETGARRLLLLRASLVRAWRDRKQAHAARLDALFATCCRPAFHVRGGLDTARLGEHLLAG
jgi:uncharacterized protein (DUF58 family)